MNRRALYVNPPVVLASTFVDYPYFANFGMLAVAAWTTRAGWRVEVADAFAMGGAGRWDLPDGGYRLGPDLDRFVAAMPDGPFDLVVVATTPFHRPWRPDSTLRQVVAAVASRWPAATTVLADCQVCGMHHVAYDGNAVLGRMPELDAVVRFAGERVLGNPDALLGLKGKRVVVDDPAEQWPPGGPPFPLLEALDPAAWTSFLWHCFEDDRWTNPFRVDAGTRPLMASSGCPYRCSFCSSNPGWRSTGRKPYRLVQPGVLDGWVRLAVRGCNARKLFLLDDTPNARPDFEAVLDVLGRADVPYEIPNGLRADRLSRTAIEKLKDRVSVLSLSAETASAASDPTGKRQDPAEVERVVAIASSLGIPTLVHWVIGFPWESRDDILATLAMADRLRERHGSEPAVQFATPIPGTALAELAAQLGLTPPGGIDPEDARFQHRPALSRPAVPAEWLVAARDALMRKAAASRVRKLIVNVTYECVNRCVFCAVGNRVRRPMSFARIRELLEEHRRLGTDALDLDGGEPMLHPDLLDVIRLARELGYRWVTVTTNGRRLSERRLARELIAAGPTCVLVSLHGPTARVHDALTGVPGSFRETVAGIRNLVASATPALDLGVNVTVACGNIRWLDEIAVLVGRLGIRKVNFQMLTPFGRAGRSIVPDLEEAASAVRHVIDRHREALAIQVVNAQPCLFRGYEHHVLPDLQKAGRTMAFVTDEEVNLFRYLAGRRERRPACTGCADATACDGFYEFPEEGEEDDARTARPG